MRLTHKELGREIDVTPSAARVLKRSGWEEIAAEEPQLDFDLELELDIDEL